MTAADARAMIRPFNASLSETMSDAEALDMARAMGEARSQAAWGTFWMLLLVGGLGYAGVRYLPDARRLLR